MKRLGLFTIYDSAGYVDRSTIYTIKQLNQVTSVLYVIVNGFIEDCFTQEVEKLCTKLIIRNNNGYDAGAYADVLINEITKKGLAQFDELVICNDTFFGPFIPLTDIFTKMEEDDSDFWGLDRIERDFLSYIVMYFCVFRKPLLQDGVIFDYFRNFICGKVGTFGDVFARYEVGIYYYLIHKGYKGGSFTYSEGVQSKENPDICLMKYNLPIWKKKFFTDECFEKGCCENLINYIDNNFYYDVTMIQECVSRKYGKEIGNVYHAGLTSSLKNGYNVPDITEADIDGFLDKFEKIYLYGAGSFGKTIRFIFEKRMKNFVGYIETLPKEHQTSDGTAVYCLDDIENDAGIIVTLNKKNSLEVACSIKNKNISLNRVLFLWESLYKEL